jgi:hypothetical protein
MRTAAICPTCATYENALCILYNGPYLANIDLNPLDSLEVALGKINTNLVPKSGTGAPTAGANYLGQLFVRTAGAKNLYYAQTTGTGALDWRIVLSIPYTGAPVFADNAAAIAGGLLVGQVYRTGDVLKIVH